MPVLSTVSVPTVGKIRQVSVSLQSVGAPPERWLSNGKPGSPLATWVAELFTSTTAPAFPLVPTNARWAAWVPLYVHGLPLPFLQCPCQYVRGVVVVPVEADRDRVRSRARR